MMFQSPQVGTHQILVFRPSPRGVSESMLPYVDSAGCGSWQSSNGISTEQDTMQLAPCLPVGMQV